MPCLQILSGLIPSDLEDPESASSLVGLAVERLGPLQALVLSHCEGVRSGVLDTSVESFDRHYAVNVRASWLLIAAFARQLGPQGGVVVALTSDHTVGNLPYGVTKGALDRLVLASAHELSERGLRANVINPGPVDTGWMDDATRAGGVADQPTGRLGTPTDTANLVRFLMSPRGRGSTASCSTATAVIPRVIFRAERLPGVGAFTPPAWMKSVPGSNCR